MKNKFILGASLIGCAVLFVVFGCTKSFESDSTIQTTSVPFIHEKFISDFVYGLGAATLEADVPAVVGIAVDTVVGFVGGRGGKTKFDTIDVLKSDLVGSFPNLSEIGGYSITFAKYNKSNFKTTIKANIVIAGAITNFGPTDIAGTYKRVSNSYLIEIKKVFPGVYVIDNPGGAGVPAFPYLIYNLKSSSGGDSISFPIQTNPCGGGLQLVGSSAPNSLSSSEYTAGYPPEIIAGAATFTMKWRVYEFPAASTASSHTGAALCQWGLGARTFEKQ